MTEARAQNSPAIACSIDGLLQVCVNFDVMHHLDGRVFYWLDCPVILLVARHALYEVPLRATLECFAQAPRGGEGLYAVAARISTFASTTLKLLATTLCGVVMADGVATILSIRPNGARSGLSDQLAQAVQISSSAQGRTSITLAKNFASKTTPFCSQWRASSQRAPNRRKLLKRPWQFRRLI